jgi:hypothetical protein
MVLATSFLTFFWALIVIYFMIAYFFMLFRVVADVFRREDLSGVAKALWLAFLFAAPLIALFAYVIVNGSSVAVREGGRADYPPPQSRG